MLSTQHKWTFWDHGVGSGHLGHSDSERQIEHWLAITLKKCIDEKLAADTKFKPEDFGKDAIDDILEKLKEKRTTSDKEIRYLRALFRRATESQPNKQSLVHYTVYHGTATVRCHFLL